jgi:hypothetical protein
MAYARTTLTTLRARLLERIGGQGKFWLTAELDYALNEALHVYQLITGEFVASTTIALTKDTPTKSGYNPSYYKSIGLFKLYRTATNPMVPTTIDDLDQGAYGWRNADSGEPAFWVEEGIDWLYVNPPPDANNNYTGFYYRGDDQLVNAGDYIQVGDEELSAIINYAQAYLAFKEGVGEGTDTAQAMAQLFFATAKRRAGWLTEHHPFKRETGSGTQAGQRSEKGEGKVGIRG